MNKRKKIILIIILISLLIIILFASINKNISKKLINIMKENNFVSDTGSLYIKDGEESSITNCTDMLDCKEEALYFDISDYILYRNIININDGVKFLLTAVYDYKIDSLYYTYRINYENGVVILKGDFNQSTKNYSCNIEYSYGINISGYYNEICDSLQEDLTTFYYDSKLLIKDSSILNAMKKNN